MAAVFITSISPFSGKSVVGVGLAHEFQKQGKKVGFFKPLGPLPTREGQVLTDENAVFFKDALGLDESLETLCPVIVNDETLADVLRGNVQAYKTRMQEAYAKASAGKDVTIVMSMGDLTCGRAMGYSLAEFAKDIDAKALVVDRYRWPMETLDGLLAMHEQMGANLAGVIFNNVAGSRRSQLTQAMGTFLEPHGIPMFGVVPADPILRAVPIRHVVEALGGKVLCGGEKVDELLEGFSIGAMHAEAALRFFRRTPHHAVITGGDRPDIHLAALESGMRCLILTGDLYPNERILARAEEMGVPIVLVAKDTSRTAEICDHVHENLSLHSARKIARITELIEQHVDWTLLNEALGIA